MMNRSDIPGPDRAQVFIDFDGTITCRDVLDELVLRYARDDSWRELEILWQNGRIGSRECLSRELGLLDVSRDELMGFLDEIEIDPGTGRLLQLCRDYRIPVAILSDGIDFFIQHILQRHGIGPVPIRANTLHEHGDQWSLLCPWSQPLCTSAAAHCKCASAETLAQPARQSIYIGDGRSDLCPARKASTVFAKNALACHLTTEKRAFIAYSSLHDVTRTLKRAWESPALASRAAGVMLP